MIRWPQMQPILPEYDTRLLESNSVLYLELFTCRESIKTESVESNVFRCSGFALALLRLLASVIAHWVVPSCTKRIPELSAPLLLGGRRNICTAAYIIA